ncbi:MAG: DUF47 family protein [Myxococcaceae bacterium]|nr:DUF47 family protein [Myxococcaceae bacterium]
MGLQSVVRWFLPREDRWFEFLEKQVSIADESAKSLATFRDVSVSAEDVRAKVQALEHEGDKLVHELEEELARTFVTPIDREDLQRLSIEIDAITDLANATARACALLGVQQPSAAMVKLMDVLTRCTAQLRQAVPRLRTHEYTTLISEARGIRALEKEGDQIYREAISRLFKDPAIDAKVLLRDREVLDDLENAIDHCEQLAQSLINLAVKHG